MAAARQHKCHSINKKWDRLAIKYIVQEWRPLDSLCGKGLNILVEAMAPHYSLPSHNHVLYNVMCLLTYHETKSYIKSILLESESIIIFNFIIQVHVPQKPWYLKNHTVILTTISEKITYLMIENTFFPMHIYSGN